MAKRSEPGSDKEKDPVSEVTLSPADVEKLKEIGKDFTRAELQLERHAIKQLAPLYEKRRNVLKLIPKFWFVALLNHDEFAMHATHEEDRDALSYLDDLWIDRDAAEPRVFTVEMHFKENPYFSDAVLKKVYKYTPPEEQTKEAPDADGFTEATFEFEWDTHVTPQATQIGWKDEAHTLTKKHPWVQSEDDEDLPEESGSFFNFFERAADPFGLGEILGTDLFPDAVQYFNGIDDEDVTDSDEEDAEDGADEIDLDRPKKKVKA